MKEMLFLTRLYYVVKRSTSATNGTIQDNILCTMMSEQTVTTCMGSAALLSYTRQVTPAPSQQPWKLTSVHVETFCTNGTPWDCAGTSEKNYVQARACRNILVKQILVLVALSLRLMVVQIPFDQYQHKAIGCHIRQLLAGFHSARAAANLRSHLMHGRLCHKLGTIDVHIWCQRLQLRTQLVPHPLYYLVSANHRLTYRRTF